ADAAGNTTGRPAPGGGTQTLSWDELNQLTDVAKDGASVASMVYDAAGTRVLRKQGEVTTLYLGGNEISLNTTTNQVSANRYYSHAGQTVAVRTGASNDTVTTLISDWQGTTHHQVVNATGALSTTWQDPYGAARGTPPTAWTGERGYVGGTKDATGLTRIGARDYDPALQRFITVDPVQDLADPLQWNPYIYSNNSPVTKSDPTGLKAGCSDYFQCGYHIPKKAKPKPCSGYYSCGYSMPVHAQLKRYPTKRIQREMKQLGRKRLGGASGSSSVVGPHPDRAVANARAANPSQQWGWGPGQLRPYDYGESSLQRTQQDITEELLGIADAKRCAGGDAASCAWLAVAFIPLGKIAKIAKIAATAERIAITAKGVDIGGAKFAQSSFREAFSTGKDTPALFRGRTIDDVADDLRSGVASPGDVPIDVIVRDGNTLILNTRSSQALIRAGVPRSAWNVVDRTGQAAYEARLTGQLTHNGLTSAGTDLP
ncbi:MAG: RHS repeat-associated core domain-containing protein, partial [Propionibacteriaceae bacterium]|nr:RHS repeat-associated core domain-containing protein [Propionibacteriaceae bacterium]